MVFYRSENLISPLEFSPLQSGHPSLYIYMQNSRVKPRNPFQKQKPNTKHHKFYHFNRRKNYQFDTTRSDVDNIVTIQLVSAYKKRSGFVKQNIQPAER